MKDFINEIKYDAEFIKGHTLQPKWYKILKVFIVSGFLAGSFFLFSGKKTLLFWGLFFSLSLILHMVYRINTNKFTRSWLDFKVSDNNGQLEYQRIGIYYYLAVAINGIVSFVISQLLVNR